MKIKELIKTLEQLDENMDVMVSVNITKSLQIKNDKIAVIIDKCCQYYGLKKAEVLSESRKREIVECRSIIMFLLRAEEMLIFESIASIFSCHHSTVIYAIKSVEQQKETYKQYRKKVNELKKHIYE